MHEHPKIYLWNKKKKITHSILYIQQDQSYFGVSFINYFVASDAITCSYLLVSNANSLAPDHI